MLGINYESSDDEEEVVAPPIPQEQVLIVDAPLQPATLEKPPAQPESITGPTQGPIAPPTAEPDSTTDAAPGSPYTASRSLMRNLTLPTVPNFDIPASPPGSPPLRPTTKFAQFLELKKKGQHFNQRLENSSVLRDPGHMARLMDFAGITEEETYASTLPEGLAVPMVFPEWAYVEELRASQKKIMKAKEEENKRLPREALAFVPAARSGTSNEAGTPSGKGGLQSAADRVMEGLNKPKASSSHSQGGPGKRKELEQRGGRSDYTLGQSKSRSPKRRRSRSR